MCGVDGSRCSEEEEEADGDDDEGDEEEGCDDEFVDGDNDDVCRRDKVGRIGMRGGESVIV